MKNSDPASQPQPCVRHPGMTRSQWLLIFAICIISINLRSILLSVGPIVELIQTDLHMSATLVGLLLTLPLLCFSAFAPAAPKLLKWRPAEQWVLIAMLIMSAGVILRSIGGITGLFAGTFISAACVSVVMVLLPSLIKKYFMARAGAIMGMYSTSLCIGAAISAAFTVPVASLPGSDWRWALLFWDLPLLVAIALWLPYLKENTGAQAVSTSAKLPSLRKNALAWYVSLFMGIQSGLAYCTFGWLPVILTDRGMTPLTAGFALSICMVAQLVTSPSAPVIASRAKDQRSTIALMLSLTITGLMTTLYAPISAIWLWSAILGLGTGGVFSMALALLVLRAGSSQVTAALSGMSQGVGYLVAAIGPVMVGILYEYTGNWHAVAVFYLLMTACGMTFGLLAGRNLQIKPDPAT